MPDSPAAYTFSIESERYHRSLRFHWVICSIRNPDWLVSWGYAPSHELAVEAAKREIDDLRCGRTVGGRMRNSKHSGVTNPD